MMAVGKSYIWLWVSGQIKDKENETDKAGHVNTCDNKPVSPRYMEIFVVLGWLIEVAWGEIKE